MTNQSHPPSDAAQLAQARTAVEVAERKARDWEDVVKRQRGEITRLLSLIGAETPIAAFSLAETWQAEKAGYMERVEALTLELDEQAHDLAADKARVHEQVMQKLAAEFPDHPWLKKENP